MSAAQDYLRYLVTLTAVLDPFLAVPIFLSVAARYDPARRARLANAITVTVFAVLVASAVFGEGLLRVIGASLPASMTSLTIPSGADFFM